MGDVARAISKTYVTVRDVELGYRGPFSVEITKQVCDYLGCDAADLINESILHRGSIELSATDGSRQTVARRLAMIWDLLTDEELNALNKMLRMIREKT